MTENTGDTGDQAADAGDQAADAGDASGAGDKSIMGGGDDAGTPNETGDGNSIMGAGDGGDGTTDGDKAAAAAAAADKAGEGAPETYADFTLPEGMTNDGETTGVFKEMAKDFNLSQEKAQKLVDFYVEGITAVVKDQNQRADSQSKEQVAAWRKETKEDPDIGGANFETSVATGMRAVKAYGDQAFRDMLNDGNTGDRIAMVRFLKKVGEDVSEDQIVHGHRDQVPQLTAGEIMYPTMKK